MPPWHLPKVSENSAVKSENSPTESENSAVLSAESAADFFRRAASPGKNPARCVRKATVAVAEMPEEMEGNIEIF